MKIVEILIVALVFMALFPTIYSSLTNPTWYVSTIGNNATYTNATAIGYPALYNTMFTLISLLIVIGLLYMMWSSSIGHGKGGLKI
jgi:hypothetical protein